MKHSTQMFVLFMTFFLLGAACDDSVTVKDSCGDGFVDPDEQCDGANLGGASCQSLGHYRIEGALTCTAACEFDLTDCGARCGDGNVDIPEGEECDGENFNGASCQSLGYGGGQIACTAECHRDLSGCSSLCGNGLIEAGETCDDRNMTNGDGCDAQCTVEDGWTCVDLPSICTPVCGDQTALGDEACDGDDVREGTCETMGYYGGELGCSEDCTLDLAACEAAGWCGDDVLQPAHEACDGGALGGGTCAGLDHLFGGTLACDGACSYDTTGCRTVISLSAGYAHTCVALSDGAVYCWGYNNVGQLGIGTNTPSNTPVQVPGLNATAVAARNNNTCALLADGAVRCWGANNFGQLGNDSTVNSSTPVAVSLLSGVVALGAGWQHNCAIVSDGTARCWGYNGNGQLGDGSSINRSTPVTVTGLSNVVAISGGGAHTCAILSDTSMRCWGSNSFGKLGNDSTVNSNVPVIVSGLSGATDLSAGFDHTCARLTDGTLRCWGAGGDGRLGNGETEIRDVPVPVTGLTGAVRVTTGAYHSCAALGDGTLRCWGRNDGGQVGDGTTTARLTATAVLGITNSVWPAGGGGFTCAVTDAGRALRCWGTNTYGQLGDGTTTNSSTPVAVVFP